MHPADLIIHSLTPNKNCMTVIYTPNVDYGIFLITKFHELALVLISRKRAKSGKCENDKVCQGSFRLQTWNETLKF